MPVRSGQRGELGRGLQRPDGAERAVAASGDPAGTGGGGAERGGWGCGGGPRDRDGAGGPNRGSGWMVTANRTRGRLSFKGRDA
jgi:hypothetical protein